MDFSKSRLQGLAIGILTRHTLRIHGTIVYLTTFTIKINHPCRQIYNSPMDPIGIQKHEQLIFLQRHLSNPKIRSPPNGLVSYLGVPNFETNINWQWFSPSTVTFVSKTHLETNNSKQCHWVFGELEWCGEAILGGSEKTQIGNFPCAATN